MSRPLDPAAAAIVVFLCLSWGFNQVAVKLAIADIPPLIQATVRSIGAALIVAFWMRLRGISFTIRDGTLIPGLVAGFFFGFEFILIFAGCFTRRPRARCCSSIWHPFSS
jgi:drug/metabolite transporter (DMT)-like permease